MRIMDPYSGDPLIIDSGDGGDLYIQGGQPRMSSGIENAAYLSLFVSAEWWANDIAPSSTGSRQFLPLIERIALTPAALKDMEKAIVADLAWMIEDGIISEEPSVLCSIIAPGMCGIEITLVDPDKNTIGLRWNLNWARMGEELK